MRRILTARAALIVISLLFFWLLAGCNQGTEPVDGDGAVAPPSPYGGTLRVGLVGDAPVDVWDLLAPSDDVDGLVARAAFVPLVGVNASLEPVPGLIAQVLVSPDGGTWTAVLREGVTWQDGRPVTAEDVIYTLELLLSPSGVDRGLADRLRSLEGVGRYLDRLRVFRAALAAGQMSEEAYAESVAAEWERLRERFPVVAEGERRVLFRLTEPDPRLLVEALTVPVLRRDGAEWVGSGPFRITGWDPLTLTADEGYFLGRPYLDEIRALAYADEGALAEALSEGAVDLALFPAGQGVRAPEGTRVYLKPELQYVFLALNLTAAPFDEEEFREALSLAVDRRGLIRDLLGGAGVPVRSHSVVGRWDYPFEPEDAPAFDREEARERLSRLEVPPLEIVVEAGRDLLVRTAAAVARELEAAGLEVRVTPVPWEEFKGRLAGRDFQAVLGGWTLGLDPDPSQIWHSMLGPYNFMGYYDPRANSLLEEGLETLDLEQRRGIYREFHRILAEQEPYLFLYQPARVVVAPSWLVGPVDLSPAPLFWNIAEWHRLSD